MTAHQHNRMISNEKGNAPVVIEAVNLQRSFGQIQAVRDFTVTIHRGEMFGIVGPDSAGKSTAIRLLCGLLTPSSGSARVLGYDLARESQKIKARVGYLSQDFTLYGDLSVDENIEFFARLHRVSDYKKRRDYLLKFTRLELFRDRLAEHLSGGMKKKLALACALIHTPEIIFLDEPSTGVDPVSRGEFWNILSQIQQQGITIVMTTPYLDEAERCHRVSLMHRGRIVVTDTPERIKSSMPGKVYDIECRRPQEAYNLLLNRFSATRLAIYGERLRFWSPSGEEGVREVVEFINSFAGEDARYSVAEPSLEDAFIAFTSVEDNLNTGI